MRRKTGLWVLLACVGVAACGTPEDVVEVVVVQTPRDITDDQVRRFVAVWHDWGETPEGRQDIPSGRRPPPARLLERHGLARDDFLYVAEYMAKLAEYGVDWTQEARLRVIDRRLESNRAELARSEGEYKAHLEDMIRRQERQRAELLAEPPMSEQDRRNFETAGRWVPALIGRGPPPEAGGE